MGLAPCSLHSQNLAMLLIGWSLLEGTGAGAHYACGSRAGRLELWSG